MMSRWIAAAAAALLVALLAAGCSVNTELGGVRVPNSRPDTRLTGQPPTLLEAGFVTEFNWTGSDPDGRIMGFQWKISDNGVDGISPRDTLTVDPVTGAVLHPWHYTTGNDTTFYVLADQDSFPGDGENPRSFRSHTLFIRAVDDQGAVDPSPAQISFTSTTIVPTARTYFGPGLGTAQAKVIPPTVNIGWLGSDPDYDLRTPTKMRFLWKPAVLDDGTVIDSKAKYLANYDKLISFDDPEWTAWVRYQDQQADREVQFRDQVNNQYYLFAVQAQDTAGAVSIGRGYQIEVAHVRVQVGRYAPSVTIGETYLGQATGSYPRNDIAAGQPLNFAWAGDASGYNGKIVSYRHGYDLLDPSDDNDPNWAVPAGLSEQNRFSSQRTFQDGLHAFYVKVVDDAGQAKVLKWELRVIPYQAYANQRALLFVDQVIDNATGAWADQVGNARDSEDYRDAYWGFLNGASGNVDGFTPEDRLDQFTLVNYEDLVPYKVVLISARKADAQTLFSVLRPVNNTDNYVFLSPYQLRGGNLFLVGENSMDSFLESLSYYTPIIFNAGGAPFYSVGGETYVVGFGQKELPDGTMVDRGPLMYPYATAGITALDWTASSTKTIYGRRQRMMLDRTPHCAGLKAITLDPVFKDYHLISGGVIPDTIRTNPIIDWQDQVALAVDTLKLNVTTFPFRADEFVNANTTTRSAPIIPQTCPVYGPDGLCIQPMFRGVSRFDWLREVRWAEGENWEDGKTGWPFSRYTENDLEEICGTMALTNYGDLPKSKALTNDKVYGWLSYKMVEGKESKKADVYWGFDPYRFDTEETQRAIRWVLEYFGLTINE